MKPEPRNIALDLILTVLLCGLWNLSVQYSQVNAMNYLLKSEKYSFWKTYLFTLLTCGIYLIFYEYRKAKDLATLSGRDSDGDSIIAVVLCLSGLSFIFDSIAQNQINQLLLDEKKAQFPG